MVSTAQGVELIAVDTGRLKECLRGAGAEDWRQDSPCEGWAVGDVIGHMGWAAEFLRLRAAGLGQFESRTGVG